MAMVAHDPAAAKRLGIPQKVGKEFTKADTGRKFKEGGQIMATKKSSGGITTAKMAPVKAGGIKKHGEHAVQEKGHTKAKYPTMNGGMPLGGKTSSGSGMKKGGKV
jgi:hypothetical protein